MICALVQMKRFTMEISGKSTRSGAKFTPMRAISTLKACGNKGRCGFTATELIVTVAVVSVLLFLFAQKKPNRNAKAPRIKCVNNLKNVGLAFRIYATDNADRFPWEPATNKFGQDRYYTLQDLQQFYLMVTNELSSPNIIACPADSDRPALSNWAAMKSAQQLSYFLGMDARETLPQSFMGGDRNLMTNNVSLGLGVRELRPDANLSWDNTIHQSQGNAVMGDGSVQQLSSARLREQMRNARAPETNWTATLIVP